MRHPVIKEDLDRILKTPVEWPAFEDRTVLVTGANGFLPAYMVETLLRANESGRRAKTHVVALARNAERAAARFSAYEGRGDLEILVQDVCQPIAFSGQIDYIIHAASQASPKYYGSDPVGTLLPNVLGTRHLLDLAVKCRSAGFLFFSSGEVYGHVDDAHVPTKEDGFGYLDPADVRSCYAESKRLGETMCVAWRHQFDVPAKIVRPFHTYGPGMRLDDGRVFADFVSDIVNGRDITLKSDGSARRAFCYLADAVAGFFAVLLRGAAGQAYNIGNESGETSISDLAERLAGLFPDKGLRVVRQEPSLPKGYLRSAISRSCPDTSKARALGWNPVTGIDEGFRRTVQSFLQPRGHGADTNK